MFNNRKFINELIKENEKLQIDIESKENQILNVLDANKELSQHNNYLEHRNIVLKSANKKLIADVETLEEVIKKHEENECRLNTKLCRAEGQLNDLDNYIKMTTGMSILDREDRK